MRKGLLKFQIGKSGFNSGLINSLNLAFKNNKIIRVNVLKSGTRKSDEINKIAEEIVDKLDGNFRYKIIGFTIVLRKVGKK